MKSKKAGTVGESIDELVERYGGWTLGIYILEQALVKAVGMSDSGSCATINGMSVFDTPAYKALSDEEEDFFKSLSY